MGDEIDQAIAGVVLDKLDLVVLARRPGTEEFELASSAPEWWEEWFGSAVAFADRSAFLEDFIAPGEAFPWSGENSGGKVASGPWEETGADGRSRFFEAMACQGNSGEELLVIQAADDRVLREQRVIQSVHEQRLNRRRLQKELEKKQILLECIMHDLGNPLATVLMNLQHLGRKLDEHSDLLPPVSRAIAQAERQRELIRSIASVFAADLAGASLRGEFPEKPVDLVAVAADTLSACAPLAAARSVTLCPLFVSTSPVLAEPFHLSRVIENLIVNAVRHSPDGGRVTIGFEESAGQIACRIEDEGSGIDPAVADRLFEPFVQGGQQEGGQAGLGLYFCRLTLEQWGGKIEAWDRPEGGACFEFRLPCAPPEREDSAP